MARKFINDEPVPYKRGGVIYEHIYEIECYPISENAQFDIIINKILILFPLIEWCYIFHDKDRKEDGTLKKPHYHLLLNFPRERSINKLADILGVPVNLIQWKAFLDKSVQYLIHLNDPDKYQYDIEQIEGNSNWYLQFLGGDFSSDIINDLKIITDFIKNNYNHITYYQILTFVNEHNLISTYRKYYSIIKDIFVDGKF